MQGLKVSGAAERRCEPAPARMLLGLECGLCIRGRERLL